MSYPDTERGFIAYVRVSTDRQMDYGQSLKSQRLTLEQYARELGMAIEVVPACEPGHGVLAGRPRYMEALQKARLKGWYLLVTDPSRLSRSVDHLRQIDQRRVPVWILGEGRQTRADLMKRVAAAERDLEFPRAAGCKFGALGSKAKLTPDSARRAQDGRKLGGRNNAERAHRNRVRVLDFIRSNPSLEKATHAELAEALNSAGIRNRRRESPVVDVDWDKVSVRHVRRLVMEDLNLERQLYLEEGF